jgi:uncharacterized protein (TIRG00374 family)
MRVRPRLALFAKITVTAVILGIALSYVEVSTLRESLSQISVPLLLVAIALEFPLLLSGVQRWRLVATTFGEQLEFRPALVYMLIALFINLGVPSVLGLDAARMWKLQRHVSSLNLAARIVITDRLCSFMSLLLIIAIGLPQFANLSEAELVRNLTVVLVLCGVIILVLVWSFRYHETFLPKNRIFKHFWQILVDLNHTLLSNRGTALEIILWGAGNHLLRVAIVFFIALSLGLNLSPIDAFTLVPVALLIAMIPISLGGWGVREAAFILTFSLAGIAPASAFALSVLYGLIGLITALIGGAIWMAEENIIDKPAS